MLEALPLLVVVALVGVTSVSLRRRTGVVRSDDAVFTRAELAQLGLADDQAALVVFTAPGCSTCGPARDVVADVAAQSRVTAIVLDATDHADLAAAHRVLRAPTTFAVVAGGRIAGRVTGMPPPAELAALMGTAAPAAEAAA